MSREDDIATTIVCSALPTDTVALHERLSERYRKPLLSFFLRRVQNATEAEDLTQEVFLRVINKGELNSLKNPDGFIFQIAANLLRDRARRAKTRSSYKYEVEQFQSQAEAFSPERVIQGKQDLQSVLSALGALSEKTRDMFVLHRLENLKYQEIADLYGISVSAVEKHISKALARLMKKRK